jgi:hypothetical protein
MWKWIKLNLFQGLAATKGDALGVISGATAGIMREEDPSIPPTIGELANHSAISLGKAVEKVFTPIKWLLFGVSAVLLLWAFIGRKS